MDKPIVLTSAQNARLQRLAAKAGRSPKEMLKYVLRDGFEYTEAAVEKVLNGLDDFERGDVVTHDEVDRKARDLVRNHAAKPKQAA